MSVRSFRRRGLATIAVLVGILAAGAVFLDESPRDTVVVVVRHAEKGPKAEDDRKTPLSTEGMKRAAALAHTLSRLGVEVVYTTDFLRTKQTVQPLVDKVRPETFEQSSANDLVAEIRSKHRGKVVLVAGHSNTVPEIVAKLGGGDIGQIEENQYDDLFIVILRPTGEPRGLRLRYGALAAD